jgi:hypothetical protein
MYQRSKDDLRRHVQTGRHEVLPARDFEVLSDLAVIVGFIRNLTVAIPRLQPSLLTKVTCLALDIGSLTTCLRTLTNMRSVTLSSFRAKTTIKKFYEGRNYRKDGKRNRATQDLLDHRGSRTRLDKHQ